MMQVYPRPPYQFYGAFSLREGWHNRTRYRFLAALPPADGDDSYDYPIPLLHRKCRLLGLDL